MLINPKSILDIGANVGEWSRINRKRFPDAHFLLIEANPGCQEALMEQDEDFIIALLGAEVKSQVPFYTLDGTATGASVYREIGTDLYQDVEPMFLDQLTLDSLLSHDQFDLIKLDTQGSELDILHGGMELVSKAKWIYTEVTEKTPYNEGAPLMLEVIESLASMGFPHYESCGSSGNNQMDMLFAREL